MFENLIGPGLFVISFFFMFLVVPWERIKTLLPLGLIGGLGVALILLYLMQNILGFWVFNQVDVINIIRIPLFLSLAWLPFVIAFSHLIAQYRNAILIIGILAAFPLGATLIHLFLLNNGMLTYHNWSLFGTLSF
ncbi:MAG: hypothetical protein Q7J85_04650 [Bacillota bacterium]|nr:hypothetical protein [Bacillota bacterium]